MPIHDPIPPKADEQLAKFTQRLTLHINGGGQHSSLHYEILRDGIPTGITRQVHTNGSPKYIKTADELHAGGLTFDVLSTRGKGMTEWLEQNSTRDPAKQGETD